jgi:hypothetical protein
VDEALTAAPGALPAGLPARCRRARRRGCRRDSQRAPGGQVVRVALTYVVSSSMSERL